MIKKAFVISVVGLSCSQAFSMSECVDITSNTERLACYDSYATKIKQGKTLQIESSSVAALDKKPDFAVDKLTIPGIVNYFDEQPLFELTPHQPNYFLAASYNDKANQDVWEQFRPGSEVDDTEVKFQISGKIKLMDDLYKDNWDLWFGYTQTSWWQLYNSDESAPFRETNYSPELFLSYYSDVEVLGMTLLQTDVGIVHQSNGRSDPISRSWNRIYADFNFAKDNFLLSIKPWYRIPEDEDDDDNRDIDDYMGYGDYQLSYKSDGHILSLLVRNNLRGSDNRGGGELSWAFPINDSIKGYVQYYNGYGESLIDYDHYVNRLSLGFLIYDWL